MIFEQVENDVVDIINKYFHENEEYFSKWRYTEAESEFNLLDELTDYFESKGIEYEISEEDGFNSPGYSNDFMAVAYKVNNGNNFGSKLGLQTVMFECI